MKKVTFLFVFSILCATQINAQKTTKPLKIGLGTSLFNLNESFNNLFFYNNSSPIFVSLFYKEKIRFETILNMSILDTPGENLLKSKGSITLGVDLFKHINDKVSIYYGPKVGYNSNKSTLINAHIGGEYFFYRSWSVSNEVGFNYLIDFQNYLQTTSSVILRFYF